MNEISDFLSYDLPWWSWSIPSIGAAVGLYLLAARYLGFRNAAYAALTAIAVLAVAIARQRWKQQGWSDRGEREVRNAEKLRNRAERARDRVNDDPDELFRDDGFRRD
ncbi:hypothetical protein Q669_29515 [Labrenzia sp. C1B10]|uniref:hypothetical protein n=1 Tax=Labrenzia sp. C1B10 TaxID=1397530 RepID=UPI0003B7FF1A|nr:hypothetical protein [Labrenzia sp. C1B10]ERP95709.1 hypothetical protein Q669_29515 [Labrenzia sp. C1B10]ERS05775.1 hypothetical protein Q675_29080 [Labrenzia sp. C1B70]